MEESPIVSDKIKDYLRITNLEGNMNDCLNQILRTLPEDPYSAFIDNLKNYCSDAVTVISIELIKTLSSDFKVVPSIKTTSKYKGILEKSVLDISSSVLTFTADDIYDKANAIFNELTKNIKEETTFNDLSIFDARLDSIYRDFEKTYTEQNTAAFSLCSLAKNCCNCISSSVYISYSKIRNLSFLNCIRDIAELKLTETKKDREQKREIIDQTISSRTNLGISVLSPPILTNSSRDTNKKNSKTNLAKANKIPNLGIQIFKCGKGISKVKFDKFFMILDMSNNPPQNIIISLLKVIQSTTKKILTAGKLGENGFRINNEGSHFSPYDTINDTVKSIEEMIKEISKDSSYSLIKITIGIDCNANSYYSDQTKKYDMDGMKKPPDSDELIEFYLKYVTDHPLITYLEDPIADIDIQGWKKLFKKFEEKNSLVKLVCKNLICNSVPNLKTHLIPIKMDEVVKKINMMKQEGTQVKDLDPDKMMLELNNQKILSTYNSLKYSEFTSISLFLEAVRIIKNKKFANMTIWDSVLEYSNMSVVDIAFAIKADMLVLSGLNSKQDRVNNFLRFLKNIQEF
jgi:enolase